MWMRVELHDASLVPAHLRPPPPPAKQPIGDSLRKALRSLSSSSGTVLPQAPDTGRRLMFPHVTHAADRE